MLHIKRKNVSFSMRLIKQKKNVLLQQHTLRKMLKWRIELVVTYDGIESIGTKIFWM